MTKTGHTRRPHTFYVICLAFLTLMMALPGLGNLPVIDRDEARYAQATVQMVETGDYLNIRFQDEARNKKPAGIYWMQALGVKAFSDPGERKIWAHRLPSILGALIAVLATYWGGIIMLGRRGAFFGAAVLAVSALFVFEAHIAKTDAMLCGMCAVIMASMMRLRVSDNGLAAFLLWAALGWAVMIKGPIAPVLILLTLIALFLWERDASWMKRLISGPGIILALLLTVPWAIMIGIETNGDFFKEAIGGDLAPKLARGQEKHGAPPGYYLLTLPILFFPGTLVLLSGILFAWKLLRKNDTDSSLHRITRLLVCWSVPFWIILEVVPTKLPNYLLPVYPALSLLCGGAILSVLSVKSFTRSRKLGLLVFFITGLILLIVGLVAEAVYAEFTIVTGLIAAIVYISLWAALIFGWRGHMQAAFGTSLGATILLSALIYQSILPRAHTLQVSYQIEDKLVENNIIWSRQGVIRLGSPQFTEPSLVYRLGSTISLGDKVQSMLADPQDSDIYLLDKLETGAKAWRLRITQALIGTNLCLETVSTVKGLNYSKGDDVEIDILKVEDCKSTDPSTPDAMQVTTPVP